MDIVNFDALKAQDRIIDPSQVDPDEDYFILGKYTNHYTTNSQKYTKYPVYAIKAGDVMGNSLAVQSVTGLNTDNTDPQNPIIQIAVDGVTITGNGTPSSPLQSNVTPYVPIYKIYTALMSQNNFPSPDPVPVILENTVGSIVWTKFSPGVYYGTLLGAFPLNKTFVIGGSPDVNSGGGDFATLDIRRLNNDVIVMSVFDNFTPSDNLLVNTSIEIRVYN